MGYLHLDSSELRLKSGKQHMFVPINRVTKFIYVAFFDAATKRNGAAFTEQSRYRSGASDRFGGHIVDRVCYAHNIKHRLAKPYHPWTNGQVERMNRTIKEMTLKAFHYPNFDALKAHVLAFVMAYNFVRHLKALRWRPPSG